MTRITILETRLGQLQEKRNQAGIVHRELEEARVDIISRMIHEYFEEVLEEGDTIKVSSNRVEFTRPQEGYKYNKELLNLYFSNKDWRVEEADEIQTSFYSTSENSEYELRRMILIGKIGQIVLDFKDDILAKYNQIKLDTKEELSKASKVLWDIEKEIREVNEQIRLIEKENLLSKLFNGGVKFSIPEDGRLRKLPTLQARWDWSVDKITSIKVTRKTTSGKSYDVEGTFAIERWDNESKKSYITESTFDCNSVRADKVEFLLSSNKELIKE
jgi:hypothetical protein